MDGTSSLGAPQMVSGVGTATLTTSALTAGTHPITAVYTNIDGNFRGSTSASFNQVVKDFTITATPTAQTISSGHQAIYSVTVTPISGLTGTIALSCSGVPANSTCSYVENESQDRDPAAFGRTARLNLGTAITEADRRAKRHPPTSGIDPVSRAVNLLESCTNPDSALITFFDSFCCLSSSQSWCKRAKRLHVVRSP